MRHFKKFLNSFKLRGSRNVRWKCPLECGEILEQWARQPESTLSQTNCLQFLTRQWISATNQNNEKSHCIQFLNLSIQSQYLRLGFFRIHNFNDCLYVTLLWVCTLKKFKLYSLHHQRGTEQKSKQKKASLRFFVARRANIGDDDGIFTEAKDERQNRNLESSLLESRNCRHLLIAFTLLTLVLHWAFNSE